MATFGVTKFGEDVYGILLVLPPSRQIGGIIVYAVDLDEVYLIR